MHWQAYNCKNIPGGIALEILLLGLIALGAVFCMVACAPAAVTEESFGRPVRIRLDMRTDARVLVQPLGVMEVRAPRTLAEQVGLGGIVVIHSLGALDNPFVAYDLACPNERSAEVTLQRQSALGSSLEIVYQCPVCKRSYELSSGWSVSRGTASPLPLVRYPVARYTEQLLIHH